MDSIARHANVYENVWGNQFFGQVFAKRESCEAEAARSRRWKPLYRVVVRRKKPSIQWRERPAYKDGVVMFVGLVTGAGRGFGNYFIFLKYTPTSIPFFRITGPLSFDTLAGSPGEAKRKAEEHLAALKSWTAQ